MTSASELFYNRRSRFGRNTVELGLHSSIDRNLHNHFNNRHHHNQNNNNNNNSRRDRYSLDGCDSLRRSSHLRHSSNRPSHAERESVELDQVNSQSASGNAINLESFSSTRSSLSLSGNDRLPGDVLLARERLLQRLRGVSLSGNRQSNRASSGIFQNEARSADDFRLVDTEDWETGTSSMAWPARGISFFDSISQTELVLIPEETNKRPPGLTQEGLESLHLEVFSNLRNGDEQVMPRESLDCSICLESFVEGDELTCLPCQHRFHSGCLEPWVRACGDCPYCRTAIVASSYGGIKGP